jgi:hypothetical protein
MSQDDKVIVLEKDEGYLQDVRYSPNVYLIQGVDIINVSDGNDFYKVSFENLLELLKSNPTIEKTKNNIETFNLCF